ncbi:MAG: trypsin-like peptidase domain-containing protein [Anaerolineae bacterium]|nr:trypsin-like peptidase domain-containing protein [Anaerolineae bacterium]
MIHLKSIQNKALFLIFLLMLTACGGSAAPQISKVVLSKDEDGSRSTTVFGPTDTFYLIADADGPENTSAKATWTAVNAENVDPNYLIDEVEQTYTGSNTLTFDLKSDNPWPVGEYKVDLSLNGEPVQSVTFRVQAPMGQTTDTTVAENTPVATPETETAVTPETDGPITTLDAVKTAAIQLEAQGTFIDPEVGTMYNAAGRGSGFIIDPSGIAVTNNHVVTGAALLKVWVGGESQPRNARILGVSECADLAVIDIDGEGFPYLQWYDGDVGVGLDVYAAGFPLGDPEYTLTRGIVSKARAAGETSWASVDDVIEHDATINPGNSGGPLVTTDGKIVAVNYAGSSDTNQYFAIAQAQALPVIEQLKQGGDFLSIGVNGTAVNDGQGISGIWVSSVKSGSPADEAGVTGGDIITSLEGLILATDGTIADYCDILRTHDPEDKLAIEVLRYSSQEILEGQLNGRELEQTFSFAQTLEQEASDDTTNSSGTADATYTDYMTISDDSGALVLDVPTSWGDVDGTAWDFEGENIGLSVVAAPSLNDFYNSWNTPGVFFGATDQFDLTVGELLDAFEFSSDCTYGERTAYEDSAYTGEYDVWLNCGGTDTLLVVLAATPPDGSYHTLVMIQVVSDADLEALDQILATFVVSE